MSLIGSLLSLAIIPLRARREERPKEVDNLAVMALADEVKRLQFALDHWRDAYDKLETEYERLLERRVALMDENARLRAENGVLRHREQAQGLAALDMTSPNYHAQLYQQAMQNAPLHNQQLAQYNQGLGQAQDAYNQGLGQLLRAEGLMNQAYGDCTCVPARADAFRNDNSQ